MPPLSCLTVHEREIFQLSTLHLPPPSNLNLRAGLLPLHQQHCEGVACDGGTRVRHGGVERGGNLHRGAPQTYGGLGSRV